MKSKQNKIRKPKLTESKKLEPAKGKILSKYYEPTPLKWRKIGDGLLGFSVFVAPCAVLAKYDALAITIFLIGGVGKFLTNFSSERKGRRK